MGFLAGKRALIVGVATDRSIAWGIAQAMHREGAELAFSYVNDKMKERVEPLAALARRAAHAAARRDRGRADRRAPSTRCKREWGSLDILVHAVAFAPREALTGALRRRRPRARPSASRTTSPATASPRSRAARSR